jgi:hypothetical protein
MAAVVLAMVITKAALSNPLTLPEIPPVPAGALPINEAAPADATAGASGAAAGGGGSAALETGLEKVDQLRTQGSFDGTDPRGLRLPPARFSQPCAVDNLKDARDTKPGDLGIPGLGKLVGPGTRFNDAWTTTPGSTQIYQKVKDQWRPVGAQAELVNTRTCQRATHGYETPSGEDVAKTPGRTNYVDAQGKNLGSPTWHFPGESTFKPTHVAKIGIDGRIPAVVGLGDDGRFVVRAPGKDGALTAADKAAADQKGQSVVEKKYPGTVYYTGQLTPGSPEFEALKARIAAAH